MRLSKTPKSGKQSAPEGEDLLGVLCSAVFSAPYFFSSMIDFFHMEGAS